MNPEHGARNRPRPQPCAGHRFLVTVDAMTQRLTPTAALLLVIPPLMWSGNAVVGRLVAPLISPMTLNLLLAACAGVVIPMLRQRLGADPALGGSVMITALTDSGGFFIFLGLATLFLL